jgi:aspartate ammonia-lyase
VAQAAIAVMGHDLTITQAVSGGNLELSQFLPLAADSLLVSLDLLAGACDVLARLCVAGIEANQENCQRHVRNATATITALVDHIGHDAADRLAAAARQEGRSIRELVLQRGLMTAEEFDHLVSAERAMQLGSNGKPKLDKERTKLNDECRNPNVESMTKPE